MKFIKITALSLLTITLCQTSYAGFWSNLANKIKHEAKTREIIEHKDREIARLSSENTRFREEKIDRWKKDYCRSRGCRNVPPTQNQP